ncbi:MAG TPA: tetratricopeptide repeat protein [Planctomycetota bacterium]|nr:tetratricopeptide repeat protein [Planctomycetota bacterium]
MSDPDKEPLPAGAQCRSLLGQPLYPPPVAEDQRAKLEQQLVDARAAWQAAPDDADALIWYGRRLGYLGQFREAVEVFSEGIRRHPEDARMWRFRGHRGITLRQFDKAVADLERATQLIEGQPDQIEPAGTPNARGIDLDTLHENVWYHLALARFLRGEYEEALSDWETCLTTVRNDDGRSMCAYWIASAAGRAAAAEQAQGDATQAAALRARGAAALAGIRPEMDIVEYTSYHQLALAWKGELEPDALLASARQHVDGDIDLATVGFGVANWHLCRGETELAQAIFAEVERGPSWHAFGHVAAEVELARAAGRRGSARRQPERLPQRILVVADAAPEHAPIGPDDIVRRVGRDAKGPRDAVALLHDGQVREAARLPPLGDDLPAVADVHGEEGDVLALAADL